MKAGLARRAKSQGGKGEGRGGEKRNKLILKKSKEPIKTGQKEDRSVPLVKGM